MKKSPDERFEKELLQALRGPMPASQRNAARIRVSRQLQATLARLEVGAAGAVPLSLEGPQAGGQTAASVVASSKVLPVTTNSVAGSAAAKGAATAGTNLALAASHPLGMLVAAFTLGVAAGGATFAMLSPTASHVESVAHTSPTAPLAPRLRTTLPVSNPSLRPAQQPKTATPESPVAPAGAFDEPRRDSPPPQAAKGAARAESNHVGAGAQSSSAARSAQAAPQADTLMAQQALLDRARVALARGQGREALIAISEHSRMHPSSELAEEREALTIKALIASGDLAGARTHAASFGALYPRSLFLPSIRAALPENP